MFDRCARKCDHATVFKIDYVMRNDDRVFLLLLVRVRLTSLKKNPDICQGGGNQCPAFERYGSSKGWR